MLRFVLVGITIAGVAVSAQPSQQTTNSALNERIACVHAFLGGVERIADVQSLRMSMEIAPAPGAIGVQPGRREDVVLLPDHYKTATRSIALLPNGTRSELPGVVQGVAGKTVLSAVGDKRMVPESATALVAAREDLARLLFSLLLRTSPELHMALSLVDSGATSPGEVSIRADGNSGPVATLTINATSCQPMSIAWERPTNRADLLREARNRDSQTPVSALMAGLGAATGTRLVRIQLSDYRAFEDIKFPTRWLTEVGGLPERDIRLVSVDVNPEISAEEFQLPGNAK